MTRPHTPITDKAEYEVRLGRHRRMVVRPELCRELELKTAALLSALEAQETALEKQAAFEAVSLDQPGSRAIFNEYVEAARIAVELRRSALALARTA